VRVNLRCSGAISHQGELFVSVTADTISDWASFATPSGMVKLTLFMVMTPPVLIVFVATITGVSNCAGVAEGTLHDAIRRVIMQRIKILCFIDVLSKVEFVTEKR
jgi:hypothetical protein